MANELWRLASARTDVTSPSRFNIKAPLSKEVCDQGPSLPSMVAAWSVSRITISVRFPNHHFTDPTFTAEKILRSVSRHSSTVNVARIHEPMPYMR